MGFKKAFMAGISAGVVMGIALFIGGAIFSRIIYGPQFAPPGKFEAEQLNAWYFIWTKVVIGIFFGSLFTLFYEGLPISKRLNSALSGLKYGFFFWLIISLWNLSHPLIYGSINSKDQLFWLVYSLCGFLAYGTAIGYAYKKYSGPDHNNSAAGNIIR